MNALFLSENWAIKKVLQEDLYQVKHTSINALFDTPGLNYDWDFKNPVYDPIKQTITYDVTYTGPGDLSVDYNLHQKPVVTKADLATAAPYLHTTNNNGVWDILLQKFDSDPETYNRDWFMGFDGTGTNFGVTTNNYHITFTNISQDGSKVKWGLSNLEWYHNGIRMYDIFE